MQTKMYIQANIIHLYGKILNKCLHLSNLIARNQSSQLFTNSWEENIGFMPFKLR